MNSSERSRRKHEMESNIDKPSGIYMQYDFMTEEAEREALKIFSEELPWPDRNGRRSLHYGYTFCYKTFKIDLDIPYKPFPDFLIGMLPNTESTPPDQVCIQYYPPGTGIPPHVDTHSAFDQLYSLSLGSPLMMRFHNKETDDSVEVDLVPRSMMQMKGDARLHWTHGIRARKTDVLPDGTIRNRQDRWSITYRWLRNPSVCNCGNTKLCDTAMNKLGIERDYRWKADSTKTEPVKSA